MATIQTGTVKFFNAQKCFGFILRDGRPDLFVHKDVIAESGFRIDQMVEAAPIQFEEGTHKGRPCALKIHKINGKPGTLPRSNNLLVSQPTSSVEFNQDDVVFGRVTEVSTDGAVLSIVARLRRDNKLARYQKTRLPSLPVPWAKVPDALKDNFTREAGYYYKLTVDVDARQKRYGTVIKIADEDDAPTQPDEVEPVALTGIGSRGQPIMELGDPIMIDVHPAELPPHITDRGGLRTMQPA